MQIAAFLQRHHDALPIRVALQRTEIAVLLEELDLFRAQAIGRRRGDSPRREIAQVLPTSRLGPELVVATAVIVVERRVHDRRRAQCRGRRGRWTTVAQLTDDVFEHRLVRLCLFAEPEVAPRREPRLALDDRQHALR